MANNSFDRSSSMIWQAPEWQVTRVSCIDSTQDTLRERIKALPEGHGLPPSVLQAEEQRQGRGQRARDWRSPRGGAYQSFAIADPEQQLYKRYIPLAIGIGLANTFRQDGLQLMLKWSNDLMYKDRKVAGILCEYLQGSIPHLIIGVGMNVNNLIPEGAIGLVGWELEYVYRKIMTGVTRGLQLCAENVDLPTAFSPVDFLYQKRISVAQANKDLIGTAQGVDQNGCLLLKTIEEVQHTVCWTDPTRGRVRLLP